MIIYLDEEGPYFSWVTHHRDGFVVDWLRRPTKRHPIVHRATCGRVRKTKSRKTHWTTGRRLKACSVDLSELVNWAEQESGSLPKFCEQCVPEKTPSDQAERQSDPHLTKLETKILEHLLEIAVIHLDNLALNYELSIQDVAGSFDKTPGQIAAAIWGLLHSGYIRLDQPIQDQSEVRGDIRLYPTVQSLRLEPAFERLSELELQSELAALE